jgi:hypothetical protein
MPDGSQTPMTQFEDPVGMQGPRWAETPISGRGSVGAVLVGGFQ